MKVWLYSSCICVYLGIFVCIVVNLTGQAATHMWQIFIDLMINFVWSVQLFVVEKGHFPMFFSHPLLQFYLENCAIDGNQCEYSSWSGVNGRGNMYGGREHDKP